MAVKEKPLDSSEEFDWNINNELQFLIAMTGHKPVGVSKYFQMACIWEKFRAAIKKNVSLKTIWDHLNTMYNIRGLDDLEDVPFPSNEEDFVLPDEEFAELIKQRKKDEAQDKVKVSKDKVKEVKKEKDIKEVVKKEIILRDNKSSKEPEKKKDEPKKAQKEPEKKDTKQRDTKEVKKEQKATKTRLKGKEELDDSGPPLKKERKDSESSRESLKRAPKRPTRQSTDNTSKASSSPRDTPPPKRRRI